MAKLLSLVKGSARLTGKAVELGFTLLGAGIYAGNRAVDAATKATKTAVGLARNPKKLDVVKKEWDESFQAAVRGMKTKDHPNQRNLDLEDLEID